MSFLHCLLRRDVDVADQADAEQTLFSGSEDCRQLIENAPEGILIMDANGRFLYVNRHLALMVGYPANDLMGRVLGDLIPDRQQRDELCQFLKNLPQRLDPATEQCLSTLLRRRDGTEFTADIRLNWLDSGGKPRITAFVRDLTGHQQQAYLLRTMATYDDLTGLPNRMQLPELLAATLSASGGVSVGAALLLMDLDHFRQVNDSLGHEFGDLLLMAVCARLVECLPPGTPLVRFSGDELVALLENVDRDQVIRVAEDVRTALDTPILINDWEYRQSVSLGIALIPLDGQELSPLVRKADLALGCAKAAGRNTYEFYDGPVAERALRRHQLHGLLRQALERREFHLHYQPRVDLLSGRISGWEALLRWNSPEEGAIGPAEFIPVAEESGLILGIGDWVLHHALAQHAHWQALGLAPGIMAINVSPRQLRLPDFTQRIAAALALNRLQPGQLEIEITETALMEDVSHATLRLNELSRLGVKLAVDDFGTGYSSLGYLRTFPLDRLKIDRSFVTPLGSDAHDEAIAHAIIVLAHSLDLTVVAEGVETEAQLRYLLSNQCEEIQGFLFSRPLPAGECERLLREDRRLAVDDRVSTGSVAVGRD
ncbi:putative bifunctional diguanylate cyclase/phosphodiesterase [Thiocystis violascens]|nr:EAL domain-containing protein [Thiocystis violascens]